MHFIYDLTGKSPIVGIIAPINESIWEHLKMPLLPTVLWWTISYLLLKQENIELDKWLLSAMISFIITLLFITAFYYTYTGAFGIKSIVLDILSLIIGVIIGQLIALRIYKQANLKTYHYIVVYVIFFLLLFMFIVFTFKPPHLPIFRDPNTGKYGNGYNQ